MRWRESCEYVAVSPEPKESPRQTGGAIAVRSTQRQQRQ